MVRLLSPPDHSLAAVNLRIMRTVLSAIAAALILASCGDDKTTTTDNHAAADTTHAGPAHTGDIVLEDLPAQSPDFKDATLKLSSAVTAKAGDSAKTNFIFEVRGFQLKGQTESDNAQYCNNSKDGQHIHFILDNQPYKALYDPKHEATMAPGSEHYLLCFLSRSYHESLKHKGAAMLTHFRIDSTGKYQKLDDPTTPMIFYSRPKGDYLGKDTANLLLDFYPWNFEPGKDGYAVKADVMNEATGQSATFTLKEWKPQFVTGLGTGACTVKLSILKDGQPVSGEHTSVTRKITLSASEPLVR